MISDAALGRKRSGGAASSMISDAALGRGIQKKRASESTRTSRSDSEPHLGPRRMSISEDGAARRRPGVTASDFPLINSARHIFLTDRSKIALEMLFILLDRSNDGILSHADFTPVAGPRRTLQLWASLQENLDFNRSGTITPIEFVCGFKELAMRGSLCTTAFAKVPRTNLELLEQLQLSANARVLELAFTLFKHVSEADPSLYTAPALTAWWDQRPDPSILSRDGLYLTAASKDVLQSLFSSLDANGDGKISIHDFRNVTVFDGQRSAARRWGMLKASFDLNNDGHITPEEFATKMKEVALSATLIGFSCIPANHRECMALLNASTNTAIRKAGEELVRALRSQ